jgi:hypothetical protein
MSSMDPRTKTRSIAVRLAQVGIGVALFVRVAACTCPPPIQLDQVFLLDATTGTPFVPFDAGPDAIWTAPGGTARDGSTDTRVDASVGVRVDGSVAGLDGSAGARIDASGGDGGGARDAAAPYAPPLDCTSMAADCMPGGDCLAACNCVLARDGLIPIAAINSCKLLPGASPPAVEVRYQTIVRCP